MKRLDGWHRIGIVIWAVSAIGFWAWQWTDASRYQDRLMDACEAGYHNDNSNIKPAAPGASELYGNVARTFSECMDRAVVLAKPQYEQDRSWSAVAFAAVLAFLTFWLPYTVLVLTVRWVC